MRAGARLCASPRPAAPRRLRPVRLAAEALEEAGARGWRRPESARVKAVLIAAASCAALFLLLLWQALHGRSLVALDPTALVSLALWALLTALGLGWVGLHSRGERPASFDGVIA